IKQMVYIRHRRKLTTHRIYREPNPVISNISMSMETALSRAMTKSGSLRPLFQKSNMAYMPGWVIRELKSTQFLPGKPRQKPCFGLMKEEINPNTCIMEDGPKVILMQDIPVLTKEMISITPRCRTFGCMTLLLFGSET